MANEPGLAERALRGSCLCGGVVYRVRGPFEAVARCHCVQCRKASGAEFATNASVSADRFELLEGADRLRAWDSSPGGRRHFCGRCGSPVYKTSEAQPGVIRIRLGLLDDAFDTPVQVRVFTDERFARTEIPDDGIPSFPRMPGD